MWLDAGKIPRHSYMYRLERYDLIGGIRKWGGPTAVAYLLGLRTPERFFNGKIHKWAFPHVERLRDLVRTVECCKPPPQ